MLRLWRGLCKLHFGKKEGECQAMTGMPQCLVPSRWTPSSSHHRPSTCSHRSPSEHKQALDMMPSGMQRRMMGLWQLSWPFLLPMSVGTPLRKQLLQKHPWPCWPSVTGDKRLLAPENLRAKGRLPQLPLTCFVPLVSAISMPSLFY